MAAMNATETNNALWDYVILVVFIGFGIAMMISGYFVDVHTIFFPIYILVLLIGTMIAGILNYVWIQIADSGTFTLVTSTSFPITSHLMAYLTLYYTIIGALALIATYAKTRQDI